MLSWLMPSSDVRVQDRDSLVYSTGVMKLADFGLSKSLPMNKHAGATMLPLRSASPHTCSDMVQLLVSHGAAAVCSLRSRARRSGAGPAVAGET